MVVEVGEVVEMEEMEVKGDDGGGGVKEEGEEVVLLVLVVRVGKKCWGKKKRKWRRR